MTSQVNRLTKNEEIGWCPNCYDNKHNSCQGMGCRCPYYHENIKKDYRSK